MYEALYKAHFRILCEIYDSILEKHQLEKLVIHSGEIKRRFQDDMPYPFFVNVHFKAIAPLTDAPDSWIVWKPGKKPQIILYQPEDIWHIVPKIPEEYWTSYFDLIVIKQKSEALSCISDTSSAGYIGENIGILKEVIFKSRNSQALISELNWYRSYKSPYEQECIRIANKISTNGHLAAKAAFYSGASELEIAIEFQRACRQQENILSYPSIVALNEHAAILHYFGRSAISPKNRLSLLIDAAASFKGYAADITRTYAYTDSLFSDMVAAVDESQKLLAQSLRVGLSYFDCSLLAMEKVAEILKLFRIVDMGISSIIESGVVDQFMPHGIGHFIGLQVHDVANNQADITGKQLPLDDHYPNAKMMRNIEPDQVVTVEPGIYFIEALLKDLYKSKYGKYVDWEIIRELKPYGGIRIEDDVLTTLNGPVNLTRGEFNNKVTI